MTANGRLTVQGWRDEQDQHQQAERERITREVLEQIRLNLALAVLVYASRPRRRRTITQRLDRFLFG